VGLATDHDLIGFVMLSRLDQRCGRVRVADLGDQVEIGQRCVAVEQQLIEDRVAEPCPLLRAR